MVFFPRLWFGTGMITEEELVINKIEKYLLCRNGDESWQKCKYLGYFLKTEEGIKCRKWLAAYTYKTFETIFNSKQISEDMTLNIYNIHTKHLSLQLRIMNKNQNIRK